MFIMKQYTESVSRATFSLLVVSPELVIDLLYCHIIIPQFSLEVLTHFLFKFHEVQKVVGVRSVECNSPVIGQPQ
jgi:hypothetical protein